MKKIRLLYCIIILMMLIQACSGSKEARKNKHTINGTWVLQSITTEGISGKIKAQILGESDINCFENSIWKFNQNTDLGTYELVKNSGDCYAKKQNIRWSIYEEKDKPIVLQYKRVDAKYYKDMEDGKAGYRLTIVLVDKTNMQLKSEVIFEDKPAFFLYNFTRK